MENYSWPSPLEEPGWEVTQPPLPREIIHAVGAIVIAWTHCEDAMLDIIMELAGFGIYNPNTNHRLGHRLFGKLKNVQRNELLGVFIEELKLDSPLQELLSTFRSQYELCRINRNLTAHAIFIEEDDGPLVQNSKVGRKTQYQYLPTDAAFWEETIFEIRRLTSFGRDIIDAAFAPAPSWPWPNIPPAPRNLEKILPVDIVDRIQPESSPP